MPWLPALVALLAALLGVALVLARRRGRALAASAVAARTRLDADLARLDARHATIARASDTALAEDAAADDALDVRLALPVEALSPVARPADTPRPTVRRRPARPHPERPPTGS